MKHISQILIVIIIVYTASRGVLFSLRFILGVESPVVIVELTSMLPTLEDGDMLLLQGVDNKSAIDIGEIIVFYNPRSTQPERIVHRIIDTQIIDGEVHFITKGDNNRIADQKPVPPENVIGIVMGKLPIFLADYIKFIDNLIVKISMIGILILLFMISGFNLKKKESLIKGNPNQE
jgi:signal peptidase I